jgi:hypothetical protein
MRSGAGDALGRCALLERRRRSNFSFANPRGLSHKRPGSSGLHQPEFSGFHAGPNVARDKCDRGCGVAGLSGPNLVRSRHAGW